jgi:hypothetical protein
MRFGLNEEQIEQLDDERFLNLAAQAEIMREIETDTVRDGVLKALENIKIQ